MRIPSLKALCDAFPQSEPAALSAWRATAARGNYRAALHKADSVISGHGGESIRCPRRGLLAVYVNTGDTYSTTLLYNVASGAWRITTWGDYVEAFERRHGRAASESLCAC
jgi:hypothetical protein